jgi:excisionase family DNA binding protein
MLPDITTLSRTELAALLAAIAGRLAEEQPTTPAAPTQPEPECFTARQVAARYNVPESWVYEQARLGNLPSVQLGRYVRFRLTEVEAALKRTRGEAD